MPIKKSKRTLFLIILFCVKLKRKVKKTKHRNFVLKQWITTQQSYMNDLKSAVQYIRTPMLSQGLIDENNVQILFPEFDGMIKLCQNMIQTISLALKQKNPNNIKFGQKLNHFASFYKLYGSYFGCRVRSENLLQQLFQTNQLKIKQIQFNLRQQVRKKQSRKSNMTISDCLQQPQYRMFKYVLLLKDYLKKLPIEHLDYKILNQSLRIFESINYSNNELMKNLQAQEKKIKLDRLFGKSIDSSSKYIIQMCGQTIYFSSKLYIFTNLVIISKLQSSIGFRLEQRFMNMMLNQFSFIQKARNMKYFQNILILCGIYGCLHLYFQQTGVCFEVHKIMKSVILNLQKLHHQRRKIKQTTNEKKKLIFALDQQVHEQSIFLPQFKIQVITTQIRPLSLLTNDTVYITRIMMPQYFEDILIQYELNNEQLFHKRNTIKINNIAINEQINIEQYQKIRPNNYLSQYIQLHLSQLTQLHKQIRSLFPNIMIPQIDPLTKDLNFYTESKKKTKTYQMRAFLLEQFLNFIFRHPIIMRNPVWIIKKFRIEQNLWDYTTQRNQYVKKPKKIDENDKKQNFNYNSQHCGMCKKNEIKSLEQFEHYRSYYQKQQNRQKYCFNFYNLVRMKILSFNSICFNTIQRILLWIKYQQGRLDYSFIWQRKQNNMMVKIYYHLEYKYNQIQYQKICYSKWTKIGQIICSINEIMKMKYLLDYVLILKYSQYERILDQDQFISDIIQKYQLKCEQNFNNNNKESQIINSIEENNNNIMNKIIDFIPDFTKNNNYIYLKKIIFLNKELQFQSIQKYFQNKNYYYILSDILNKIKNQQIILSLQILAQISILLYFIKQKQKQNKLNQYKKQIIFQIAIEFQKLYLSNNYCIVKENRIFMEKLEIVYKENYQRNKYYNKNNNNHLLFWMRRILELCYCNIKYYTYFTQVPIHYIPSNIIIDQRGILSDKCLLGINYKQIIIMRNKLSIQPAIRILLQDIQITQSLYSILIHLKGQDKPIRFNRKMLHGFCQLIQKYKLIQQKFNL